ncbi:hypothetical protein TNCV_1353721 [Trichonephila clavipes]|nr:hypothetical protein TNCV_1353721 [Trichonephila clavipes]
MCDKLKRQMPSCHSVYDLELAVQDLWAHLPQDNIRCTLELTNRRIHQLTIRHHFSTERDLHEVELRARVPATGVLLTAKHRARHLAWYHRNLVWTIKWYRGAYIDSHLTVDRYVTQVVQPAVLPLLQCVPSTVFQKDNARLHVQHLTA